METSFNIHFGKLTESRVDDNSHITIFRKISDEEERVFLKKYNLPQDVFYFDDIKPVAPRYENIQNKFLGETIILVLSNIVPSKTPSNVEDRLESHVFILGEQQLFWFIKDEDSQFDKELIKIHSQDVSSIQSIIMHAALLSYSHFTEELAYQKEQIDYLNKQADNRTSNEILSQVTDTERNLVILEHTISTQENAIHYLLKDEGFLQKLENDMLIHDVKWYNRQVNKLIHVYRDLFDAVSSLYSDIVTNNLNRLMKFLSSLSIILAASSLIAEMWGMNTGGLPFENHKFGTFIMISIALIAGVLMYFYLKLRKFFDD